MLKLRQYQQQAIDSIPESGRYLLTLATGTGKTVIFSHIPRRGRMLILAHREELLDQTKKYFDCSYGVEQADRTSNGEEVVAGSIQSIHRRLNKFRPDEFDIVIVDEAHRSAARLHRKVIDYFKPRLLVGFTATVNRSDGIGLDGIYDKIVFEKGIEEAIKEGFLCDIHCLRANIGYNLSGVKTRLGDFDSKELDRIMIEEKIVKGIAETYYKYAKGQTLIFAVSVKHAEKIASCIEGSVSITGETKDRSKIIESFTRKDIKCLVNVAIFVEGIDLPNIETIIFAAPTKSSLRYIQSIGRGLRLCPGKDKLTLIDCVGNTGRNNICSAPTLLGLDIDAVVNSDKIEGDLFSLPEKILIESDLPESWIKNVQIVSMFAREHGYTTNNVNYFKMPDGTMICQTPQKKLRISPIDKLGHCNVFVSDGRKKLNIKAQEAFDVVFKVMKSECMESQYIWDLSIAKRWGSKDASDKQKAIINRRLPKFDTNGLTKLEAGCILNRLFTKQ